VTTALASVADVLEQQLSGLARVERAVPVARLTTYRLGGPAAVLVRVGSRRALPPLAEVLGEHRPPVLVVGRGSNLLVADAGFAGVAIVLEGGLASVDVRGPRETVRAGAGAALPVVARTSAAAGRSGLEFFVGIPGSVGGAVCMNAGGHGRDTRAALVTAEVFDLAGGTEVSVRDRDALGLGYRTSGIGPTELVVAAELAVTAAPASDCEAAIGDIVRWRREHQPGGSNAGSVFRNPEGDSAGRIIDALGLKGLRVGRAVVSAKHANFFQAEAGATADDVHRLVIEVQTRVRDATGIELVPELQMVGFEVAR
jgi:UDP-N-acetylmuramate dehydrogenase